jgi:ketosteroid isomerase-like protein
MSWEVVARYFEMWNTGDTSIADEILDGAWVDHAHPEVGGPDDVKRAVERIRTARPDLRFQLDTILIDPTVAVTTDGGDGGLFAAVGSSGGTRLIWLIRVRAGRLVEMWTYRAAG